jgi:hypothetical protein
VKEGFYRALMASLKVGRGVGEGGKQPAAARSTLQGGAEGRRRH